MTNNDVRHQELLPRQREFIAFEIRRNTEQAKLFTDVITVAFGKKDVIVGHHITFEQYGDIKTENEIPSADTLIFDCEIARRVFGKQWSTVLARLALTECDDRDAVYAEEFYSRHPHMRKGERSFVRQEPPDLRAAK